ncbi:unnamed protein product (macronuclear) [Paramecium tetraurelia]|uniref:RING-type domain-containing protein n=1 Tax=Paramecium tetraurelia TaxID=5888 RepID=A0CXD9_PARTE|nr:uncharacterized protein GSPATT00011088001 [Paramecium tetraurelia]CAK75456.1 unnamed protein product [Paramecium tetraurelia]|eukprot:XP_001442853.1 hypothetical protein (macronuclear) [Paramecium tetraurelia strain d4-2]
MFQVLRNVFEGRNNFDNYWCHLCKMEIIQRTYHSEEDKQEYCLLCESPLEQMAQGINDSELRSFEIYISPEAQSSRTLSDWTQSLNEISDFLNFLSLLTENLFYQEDQQLGASETQISTLREHVADINDQQSTCYICQEDFKEEEVELEMSCSHNFHKDCLTQWLKINNSCPVCRAKIN